MFPTLQWDSSNFPCRADVSYYRGMMDLQKLVSLRLKQLGIGAVEAATAAGIERTYIRDIVEGKKRSVRSDKISSLAAALKLNRDALARGELVPSDTPAAISEKDQFLRLLPHADDESKRLALAILRKGQTSSEEEAPET